MDVRSKHNEILRRMKNGSEYEQSALNCHVNTIAVILIILHNLKTKINDLSLYDCHKC